MSKTPLARECRFVVHIPSYDAERPDAHMVKETIHYDDGTSTPHLRFIKDYSRPFWATKKAYRTHEQKKEWESLERLDRYDCTQSQLRNHIAKVLERPYSRDGYRQLTSSPYIYGSDITACSLIKKGYQTQYPDYNTPYSVATFDVETDMLHGHGQILIATATFENKIFTAVQANFVKGLCSPELLIESAMNKYLGEYVTADQLHCEVTVCEDEISVVRAVFARLHEWKPDWLSIWNMDFDVSRLLEACERAQVDPKTIFCDPSIPMPYRIFKYRQGKKKRITASGRVIPIKPAEQWHVVQCTSSFYWIDAMCVYKQIRLSKAEERSYALDAILNKVLGIRKLKFEAANAYQKAEWHQFMQQHYPVEYIIYNRFDSWSMQLLDRKTKDLSVTLPVFAESAGFEIFDSQPKQIATALHFECLEQGLVVGTAGSSIQREPEVIEEDTANGENEDDDILSLDGWIVTLKSINMIEDGVCCIQENPLQKTAARMFVFDSDSTAAYPSATTVANVSKETTKCELIDIDGIDEEVFRMANINLLSGPPNAIQYCTTMFNFPSAVDWLKDYQMQKG